MLFDHDILNEILQLIFLIAGLEFKFLFKR